jgi:hypothetical protein
MATAFGHEMSNEKHKCRKDLSMPIRVAAYPCTGQPPGVRGGGYRARASLPAVKQYFRQMLREISPIGEISPVKVGLGY